MEEAPENGKELSHSAHDSGMNMDVNETFKGEKSKVTSLLPICALQ
jgi:hypothetical protein